MTIFMLFAVVWTEVFGNCGFIDAFWQLLDLSLMHIKTEIRPIKYSEFHNYFGAVCSGPD
jgi:hypothetical protein